MNCPVCKGSLAKYTNLIDRCSSCGVGVTKESRIQESDYHRDEQYLQEDKLFGNIFARRVKIITDLIRPPGLALEIGCSTGILLSQLKKKGWDVMGVEVSKLSAQEATKKDLEVFNGKFEDFHSSKKFDLVILNHVLEHLNDPLKIIEQIFSLLTDRGAILIDVPNFGSLSARIQKNTWPLLLPSEHLWHFTEESLIRLLTAKNFEIIFCEKASGIWDFGNPPKELFDSLTNFKRRFFSEILTALPALIVSKLGLGTDLLVVAKKK